MAKMILVFAVVFVLVFAGITAFRSLSKKERWALTKVAGYSIIVAVVTVLLLTLFVMVF
jgi:lipopolysaccharide export LptBFGC system permease protein LptF